MSFYHSQYLLYIIGAVVLICLIFFKLGKKDSSFIETYWGLKPNLKKKLSVVFSLIGICGLLFALLDLRGAGEKIEANISQEKTVIMIDASSSMLAEDVKPNRFEKSIFLARHFIRRAIGHEIAVILFSDTHRKLVPFTSDLDLLDARLEALAKRNLSRGGTGLSLAIQESVNYLRDSKGKRQGNILIFTDGEENQSFAQLKIPGTVNVAVVGVGTVNGGRIPMRSLKGDFQGYMRFEGKEIISKLSEKSIRSIGENIQNFEYWVASSYSLPTDNILKFLTSKRQELKRKGEVVIRPVKFQYIVIPSLVCWIVGMLLSWGHQYHIISMLIFMFVSISFPAQVKAQGIAGGSDTDTEQEDKSFAPFSEELIQILLTKVKKGGSTKSQKLKLAQEILKSGDTQNSLKLYEENHQQVERIQLANAGTHLNWATSQLFFEDEEGKNTTRTQGLRKLTEIESSISNIQTQSERIKQIKKIIRANRFLALQAENQKRKEEQKKKKKDKNKGDKDKKKNQDGQKGEDSKSQDSNGDGKPKDSDKDQKDDSKNKKDPKDNNDKAKDRDKKKDKKKSPSRKDAKKKRRELTPQDISNKLKQLLDDDKQLQRESLDTRTRKRSRKNLKNW